jgi:hypothetical protein
MKKSQRAAELRRLHEEIEALPRLPDDWTGQRPSWNIITRIVLLEAAHRLYMDGLGSKGGRPAAKRDPDWAALSGMRVHDWPEGTKSARELARMAVEMGGSAIIRTGGAASAR